MLISPCVRNCCLDQQDCCLGCGRFLTEILQWQQLSEQQQHLIIEQAKQRQNARQPAFMHPAATPSEQS
ncbi:DUF1289 domain-containing protein [Arsukibacterium sp.]|uniref:DUF1289 domain-containing protein n=1 Tax=Arsukibacterium sp. TaxID=1977258 RepID=UPI00299E25D0|nr:DUF1289 domain-containing protein [Arsukibacterium sp.]MDX1536788.1 DUF1289 domain-containing protein [Arsukibacterium sp.]